jgi:RNA polymerase sigma-70 factor (ECF subfamily)
MDTTSRETLNLQSCIDRLQNGHEDARNILLDCASARLLNLTRAMLKDFPRVHRWEETDDVFQNAALRLHSALKSVTPTTVPEFISLAALQIRRELLDLARHYYGPEGHGACHASKEDGHGSGSHVAFDPMQSTHDPSRLAMWSEFHQSVSELPDESRQAFDMLWYQGLSQVDVAKLLGVTERTVQRRWQQARLAVHKAMKSNLPGLA